MAVMGLCWPVASPSCEISKVSWAGLNPTAQATPPDNRPATTIMASIGTNPPRLFHRPFNSNVSEIVEFQTPNGNGAEPVVPETAPQCRKPIDPESVSYTHLTLPTS